MVIPILLLIFGLILLIKGGDYFVDGASGIARRLHIPELLIGATVVSVGTTLPEVMVSSGAALQGSGSLAYGNAIGSIICNTCLIAALTVAVKPGAATRSTLILPISFFFASAVLYCGTAYFTGYFSRAFGIILLSIFLIYMVSTVLRMKKNPQAPDSPEESEEASPNEPKDGIFRCLFGLVIGAALIAFGSDFLVDNAIILAERFGISEKVIGLTIVALGTSLPELVTAVTSLVKGHSALSLGNIIGANLFNLILVSGAAITICPFELPVSATLAGKNASLVLDLPIMLGAMAVLTLPTLWREKLSRWQGFLLLAVYAVFCTIQFTI